MFVVWDIRAGVQYTSKKINAHMWRWHADSRYINKISDTTIILQPKGRHYRDVLKFMFAMPLGTLKCGYWILKDASMAFLRVLGFIGLFWPVFGGLLGPLGCLGCLWTAIEALFVTSGGPSGRLWSVIGFHLSPLGFHWDAFGRHWGSVLGLFFIVWNFLFKLWVL